ncbi:unnamed protein product [Amoebophrya sp. A120]|nr:unnamed protein product [Amoebophrya sp. A120]|eukprot:GSA120T00013497001.1
MKRPNLLRSPVPRRAMRRALVLPSLAAQGLRMPGNNGSSTPTVHGDSEKQPPSTPSSATPLLQKGTNVNKRNEVGRTQKSLPLLNRRKGKKKSLLQEKESATTDTAARPAQVVLATASTTSLSSPVYSEARTTAESDGDENQSFTERTRQKQFKLGRLPPTPTLVAAHATVAPTSTVEPLPAPARTFWENEDCNYHSVKFSMITDTNGDFLENRSFETYVTLPKGVGLLHDSKLESWKQHKLHRVVIILQPEYTRNVSKKQTKETCNEWAKWFKNENPYADVTEDGQTHLIVPYFRPDTDYDIEHRYFMWGNELEDTPYGVDGSLFHAHHGHKSTNAGLQKTSFEILDLMIEKLIPRVKTQILIVGQAGQRYAMMSNFDVFSLQDEDSSTHVNRIDILFGQENSYGYLDAKRTTGDWKLKNCRGPNENNGKNKCDPPGENDWTETLKQELPETAQGSNLLYAWFSKTKEEKYDFADNVLQGETENYLLQQLPQSKYASSTSSSGLAQEPEQYLHEHVFPRFKLHFTIDPNDRCTALHKHEPEVLDEVFKKIYDDSKKLKDHHSEWLYEKGFCTTASSASFSAKETDVSRLAFSQGLHRFQRAKAWEFWMREKVDKIVDDLVDVHPEMNSEDVAGKNNIKDEYLSNNFQVYNCDQYMSGSKKCRHNLDFMKHLLAAPAPAAAVPGQEEDEQIHGLLRTQATKLTPGGIISTRPVVSTTPEPSEVDLALQSATRKIEFLKTKADNS